MRADAKLQCSGRCNGSCTGTCKASGSIAAKCDGKCDADYEPLKCEGGKLEGGCKVDADCQASCNASASAKAECTPPEISIVAQGSVSAEGAVAIESLKRNLPNLLIVLQAGGLVTASVNVAGNAGKLGVKGTACAGIILETVRQAADNATVSVEASGSVVAAVQ
jgi:hypothetical protein